MLLFIKSVSVCVIKIKSDYTGLWWVPNPITGVHKEEEKKKRDSQTRPQENGEILDKLKNVKDCQEAPGSRKQ